MKSSRFSSHDMVLCAVATALLAISAWICIPVGSIGFTMQTFSLFLILELLGGRRGTIAFLIYLLLGVIGLPVFSGFRGGLAVLLGPTGGYLLGFLLASLLYWYLTTHFGNSLSIRLTAITIGMLADYICGSIWYLFLYNGGSFWVILLACVIPYLLPDILKISLAVTLSTRLKKARLHL